MNKHDLIMICIALGFNAFDFVSGFLFAVKNKNIQSSKMRDGLFKKVGFIMCYGLAYLVDYAGSYIGLEIPIPIIPVVIGYTVLTEIVSIIENICKLNPDLMPEKLKELFHVGG